MIPWLPYALDAILAGMAAEGAGLVVLHARTGKGIAPGALLPNLAAGMCLLLAMRLGLAGAWWGYVSAALLGALAGHLTELRRSWQ